MDKQQFKAFINKIEKAITIEYKCTGYDGVCYHLGWHHYDRSIEKDFDYLLSPRNNNKRLDPYWLGSLTKENIPKRQIALRLFEAIALDEELYREY